MRGAVVIVSRRAHALRLIEVLRSGWRLLPQPPVVVAVAVLGVHPVTSVVSFGVRRVRVVLAVARVIVV